MKIRALFPIATLISCSVFFPFSHAEEKALPGTGEKAAQDSFDFKKEFLSSQAEILDSLEKANPKILGKLSKADIARLLKEFTGSLNAGVELLPSLPPSESAPKLEQKREPFQAVTICKNKIFYIRLDDFGPESFAKLKEDSEAVSRLKNRPLGIIIDLRNCSGSTDYQDAMNELLLFCPGQKILEPSTKSDVKRIFDLPLAILTGEKTSGAAEVFVSMMSRSRQGLSIGSKTAGAPFTKKTYPLKDGSCLLIPEIPDFLGNLNIPATPINPAIETPKSTQLPYDKLSGTRDMEEIPDKCLTRAIDLLVSLDAIKEKIRYGTEAPAQKTKGPF
ncbi:MAG: hypothetical protein A2X49_02350 [Lentisphaerae bacterium GWF2_52_8]|nr:MAG: hypothetical protein A2X49_02350 [Lentisphaerae bacterium GWF2_52_8]